MVESSDYDNNNTASITEEYLDLYQEFLSIGKSHNEAIYETNKLQNQEENYLASMEQDVIQIRKVVSVAWLEKHVKWSHLSYNSQEQVLWQLGMDVSGKSWYTKREKYRGDGDCINNLAPVQDIIYAGERLDWEWLTTKYDDGSFASSEEARHWRNKKREDVYYEDREI